MYHISVASGLLSRSFVTFTSMRTDGPYLGFQSVDFGVNSITLGMKLTFYEKVS